MGAYFFALCFVAMVVLDIAYFRSKGETTKQAKRTKKIRFVKNIVMYVLMAILAIGFFHNCNC